MKRLAIVLLAACACSSFANAGISYVLSGLPAFNGTDYTWAYNVNLNTGESIGQPGTQSYFTVYDFAGLTGVGALPSGWTFTEQLTGVTPPTQLLTDNPTVLNVTFSYNGPPLVGLLSLGTFTLTSSFSGLGLGVYAFQTNAADGLGGFTNVDQGQGQTNVPAAVPEPASMTLLGGGLIGLIALRRKRAR